jgi:hypothetical protein
MQYTFFGSKHRSNVQGNEENSINIAGQASIVEVGNKHENGGKKYAILPQQCIIGKISNLNAGLTKETAETVLTNQVIEVQIGEQKGN